jgi:GT2 family glycosyltransferase
VFYSTRTVGNDTEPKLRVRWPEPTNALDESVTVIVPVYGDYEVTRQCLESLLPELRSTRHRAIVVNDATPDPHIAKYLASLATEPNIDVLVNTKNFGFIGSVNRALEQANYGDVILLNSDTIVPPGFIDRLAKAAKLSPDIGTVTPLSNNGEFVSFPISNTANPIGSGEEIKRIDFIAATTNADKVVDIPTGVGFCLYITRTCLDAVGLFGEDFDSGYLEDADFCLRAREYGFRSVCAPSVYVAHAGSKSYRDEKRSLVVRNLRVLEHRFPQHRRECAAFMAADPLRKSRETIERAMVATTSYPRLLITAAGATGTIARKRAREFTSDARPVMIAEVRHHVDGTSVKIFDSAGGIPQSIRFDLSTLRERESLGEFVRDLQPSQVELVDPASLPFALVDIVLKLDLPYDIFISDGSLLGQDKVRLSIAAVPHSEAAKIRGARQRQVALDPSEDWRGHWQAIVYGAQRILVPCAQAEVFAANILPKHIIKKIERSGEARHRNHARRKATVGRLGLVPVRSCVREQWLMNEIARSFAKTRRDVSITVIGATLDDIGLMRSSNAFVTGIVDADELDDVVNALGLGSLFLCTTGPLFGHPIQSVVFSSPLPVAYFDWSAGRIKPKKKDLPLDPKLSIADVMDGLSRWIPKL